MTDAVTAPIPTARIEGPEEIADPSISDLIAFVATTLPSGATISGTSWGGFNVYGDKKSMKEFQRIFNAEDRALSLQRVIIAEREALATERARREAAEAEIARLMGLLEYDDRLIKKERSGRATAEAQVASLTETVGKLREAQAIDADANYIRGVRDGLRAYDENWSLERVATERARIARMQDAVIKARAALSPTEPEAKET